MARPWTDEHLTEEQRAQVTDDLIRRVVVTLAVFDGERAVCTSAKLAELCGVDDGATHPVVRSAIAEAIRLHLAPICSCSGGYFTAVHEDQIRVYVESLHGRAFGINQRADDVSVAWERRAEHVNQTRIDEPPARAHWEPEPEEYV